MIKTKKVRIVVASRKMNYVNFEATNDNEEMIFSLLFNQVRQGRGQDKLHLNQSANYK